MKLFIFNPKKKYIFCFNKMLLDIDITSLFELMDEDRLNTHSGTVVQTH